MQAINRVHRIGQKTSTHVYRYLIEDTIEERIVQRRNLNRSTINKKFKVLSGAVGEAVDEDDLNYVMSPYIED